MIRDEKRYLIETIVSFSNVRPGWIGSNYKLKQGHNSNILMQNSYSVFNKHRQWSDPQPVKQNSLDWFGLELKQAKTLVRPTAHVTQFIGLVWI